MASQVVPGVIPWIIESGFFLALSWRLNQLPWWWEFIAAAVVTLILDRALHRKYAGVQVALQRYRRYVSAALVALLVGTAAFMLFAHRQDLLPLELKPADFSIGALAIILGHVIRRTAGHAISPGLVQSAAGRQKAELFGVLTIATLAAPQASWSSSAMYLTGIACGVGLHWVLREYEYFRAEKRRRACIAHAALDPLQKPLWEALELYARGATTRARRKLARCDDTSSRLLAAMIEYERENFAEALMILREIEKTVDRSQAAKVQALLARVHYAHGDEREASDALAKAEALDSQCPIVAIAKVTLCDMAKNVGPNSVDELSRILNVAKDARGRLTRMDAYLVNIAYDVNPAFFYDALAVCLYRKGHLRFAEEVIGRAVQLAPRFAVARLHQGVILAARMDQAELHADDAQLSESEKAERTAAARGELAELARIALELAVALSPEKSVTAKRARKLLATLPHGMTEELAF